jgi:hypothetical protein
MAKDNAGAGGAPKAPTAEELHARISGLDATMGKLNAHLGVKNPDEILARKWRPVDEAGGAPKADPAPSGLDLLDEDPPDEPLVPPNPKDFRDETDELDETRFAAANAEYLQKASARSTQSEFRKRDRAGLAETMDEVLGTIPKPLLEAEGESAEEWKAEIMFNARRLAGKNAVTAKHLREAGKRVVTRHRKLATTILEHADELAAAEAADQPPTGGGGDGGRPGSGTPGDKKPITTREEYDARGAELDKKYAVKK